MPDGLAVWKARPIVGCPTVTVNGFCNSQPPHAGAERTARKAEVAEGAAAQAALQQEVGAGGRSGGRVGGLTTMDSAAS
jgi:hypothetical protein